MSRRLPHTPLSQIRSALRQLWLRSRERAQALKNAGYCCERCGRKQSKAKGQEVAVSVHHRDLIDWAGLLELIRERLLQSPEKLEALCDDCHQEEHKEVA
jgi:5-methylcytosine-specific restriction endonuclease McrA